MTDSYILLLNILKLCYYNGCRDDLAPLLGEMDIDIFADGMPADLEVLDLWKNIYRDNDSNDVLKEKIIDLLNLLERMYTFDFSQTKIAISNMSDNEINLIRKTGGRLP